nr:vindoline biosynthesis repressor [Catharanthus roseus]
MALEALSSNELLNFIIYDTTISTSTPPPPPHSSSNSLTNFLFDNNLDHQQQQQLNNSISDSMPPVRRRSPEATAAALRHQNNQLDAAVQGRKKRRRRQRVCKNKEEAENQRMTHIAVERNRRKQMNEHLSVLRSLMPESYVQRGDQASIVGGAIEFVKELEHHLQCLEAQKFTLLQQDTTTTATTAAATNKFLPPPPTNTTTPFAQFFTYPQYTCSSSSTANCSQIPNNHKYTSKSKAAIADIEVTLIETHANVRILSRRRFRQISKLVTGFQTLYLTILHLNVTTLDPLVLYSISAKVEEGCVLNSADDIAGAVHHILGIIEEEANLGSLCGQDSSSSCCLVGGGGGLPPPPRTC